MQHPSQERPVGHPSWWWASVVGLAFGATSSVLNHLPAVGPLAAAVGVGAGWFVFGVAAALVIAVRHPTLQWGLRTAVVAVQYVMACTCYYVADWLFARPALRRLQEEVRAGTLPDPGGISLAPDWQEWLFWSAASVPAAVLTTGVTWLLLRLPGLRPTRR